MKRYIALIINISLLLLFYICRCLILNVNSVFNVIIFIETVVIVALLVPFINKENRTTDQVKIRSLHITLIAVVLIFVGHLTSVLTLYLFHYNTIRIFEKHQAHVPVADRINGSWILDERDFNIDEGEREILRTNYLKSSPCYFSGQYCYFELGGYLRNTGGYCMSLNNTGKDPQGTFGFHRIKKVKRLVANWMYYE